MTIKYNWQIEKGQIIDHYTATVPFILHPEDDIIASVHCRHLDGEVSIIAFYSTVYLDWRKAALNNHTTHAAQSFTSIAAAQRWIRSQVRNIVDRDV